VLFQALVFFRVFRRDFFFAVAGDDCRASTFNARSQSCSEMWGSAIAVPQRKHTSAAERRMTVMQTLDVREGPTHYHQTI
jgi:hypothetical protein